MSKADNFLKYLINNIGKWSCSVCGTGSNQPAAVFRILKNRGYQFEEIGPNRWAYEKFCPVCGQNRTHYKLLNVSPQFEAKKRISIDAKTRSRILNLFEYRDAFSGASISSVPEIDHKTPWTRMDADIDAKSLTDNQIKRSFQLLTREHNLLKDRMCAKCKETNVRPPFLGMKFWYDGTEEYKGTCYGCGWYDGAMWRKTVDGILGSAKEKLP